MPSSRFSVWPPSSFSCRLCGVLILSACAAFATAQQQTSEPPQSSQPAPHRPEYHPDGGVQAKVPDQPDTAGKTVISDQAEYSAFMAASNTPDPKEQAEAFESFAQKYPKSVVATNAMEESMADWQKVGDSVKVLEVAKEILAADPANIRVMAIVVALDRVSAAQGDASALDELCLQSTGGMREVAMWQRPEGMADADFSKLHRQMDLIFTGAAGYCALQQRNFSQAHDWFLRVVQMEPNDLQDTYLLAIADLELDPLDATGFWYCAKAVHLAAASTNAGSAGGMESYCKPKYVLYHGSDDGWNSVMAMAAAQSAPPAEFAKAISAAPPKPPAPPASPDN